MKQPKPSPVEAVRSTFPRLAEENMGLRQEIAEIAQTIVGIEDSLRQIKLDVSAWHKLAAGENREGDYRWSRELGYTRDGAMWSILLRELTTNVYDDEEEVKTYDFQSAPPWMCIEAVGKIPELLHELLERTRTTRTTLTAKKMEIKNLASEIAALADQITKSEKLDGGK